MKMDLTGYPKEVVIKSGEQVVLRPMVAEDGQDVRVFFSRLRERERFFVRDDDTHPEIIVPWPGFLDYARALPILAFTGDRLVGIATLHRSNFSWAMHLGNVRITVAPEYRRKGLGRILAGELYSNALQCGLDKIVTEIVKDQVDVSLFYNDLGFRTEASLSDHFLDVDGVKHDVLIMSNSLKQLWKYWVEQNEKTGHMEKARAQ